MPPRPDDWRTPDADALLDALLDLPDREAAAAFLRDLCTIGELRDLAQRWAVVRLLDGGLHYSEISRQTGASTATITSRMRDTTRRRDVGAWGSIIL